MCFAMLSQAVAAHHVSCEQLCVIAIELLRHCKSQELYGLRHSHIVLSVLPGSAQLSCRAPTQSLYKCDLAAIKKI